MNNEITDNENGETNLLLEEDNEFNSESIENKDENIIDVEHNLFENKYDDAANRNNNNVLNNNTYKNQKINNDTLLYKECNRLSKNKITLKDELIKSIKE
jgi:hypothetical protein